MSTVEYTFPIYTLEWFEYIIFGLILIASLGIGVFFGFFDKKNKTNEDFLMGGRSMSVFPVTLSLICSIVSAIALLGNPVEVYFYGTQYAVIALGYIPMILALAYLYVPVYFELQLTSAYQYFEWRFSPKVRFILSVCSMAHLMFYMPTTVWGPSLALEQVAGLNAHWSAAVIFLVCIGYSSIGGLKAVLWTDALQAFVMIGCLIVVFGAGVKEVGGLAYIWETANDHGRIEFFNFDPDPRTRHTFWTSVFGAPMMWLSAFAGMQGQVQRYNSVPSLTDARKCLFYCLIGLFLIAGLTSIIGVMLFAKYAYCDPVTSKRVTSSDQILPLFVMDALEDYPVIPGVLVAGMTCASLSSVSSALNALAAIIVEDYVKMWRPNMSQIKLGYTSKLISGISGLIAFGLVFIVAVVNETIQVSPFASLLVGCLVAPICGAFTLGMCFPWANDLGALLGLILSILISGFVGLGSILAGREGKLADQRLPLSTVFCNESAIPGGLLQETNYSTSSSYLNLVNSANSTSWKDLSANDSCELKIWSISYNWQSFIGAFTTVIFGLLISGLVILIDGKRIPKVNKRLLSQPFLRFWVFCFGRPHLEMWVEFEPTPLGQKLK